MMATEKSSSARSSSSRSGSGISSSSNAAAAATATAAAPDLDAQFMDSGGSATGKTSSKVGVLLLNLGGPEKLDDVQPFLYNLFADPDIIRYDDEIVLVLFVEHLKRKIMRIYAHTHTHRGGIALDSILIYSFVS